MMKRADWNRLADAFESEVCDITREERSGKVERFVNAAKLPSDSVLVDLGCGIGTFVSRFGSRFARVVAVDHASKIVARARASSTCTSPVKWMVMDVSQAGEKVGPLSDLTVCMNVITSSSREMRDALWRSVAMVTKPGGYALIVVPSFESDKMVRKFAFRAGRADEFTATRDGLVTRDGAVQKHFTREELAATLAANGFKVSRMGPAAYPWAVEGLRKPSGASGKLPWDWMCLARRL
jgi:SAM-dependent methyltransferase